ncbi:MAG: hydantoinase B/oxoprolinase family protein [Egibacteraceae bacterium]
MLDQPRHSHRRIYSFYPFAALVDCVLTVQSERREHPSWGLAGGSSARLLVWPAGQVGRNLLIRAAGGAETLPSKGTWQLKKGDRVRIETPGGGWGHATTGDG